MNFYNSYLNCVMCNRIFINSIQIDNGCNSAGIKVETVNKQKNINTADDFDYVLERFKTIRS